jgi:hypothetical protein
MDYCCLNRPGDDQTQDIIRIESDVIMAILFKCFYSSWKLIGSDVIEYEIIKTLDTIKRNKTLNLYSVKKEIIALNDNIEKRASEIQKRPIGTAEFMLQFDSGYGDYTKERHNWLDNLTIEDLHVTEGKK